MSSEIWKSVKGYEGLYSVSNMGNVKSEAHIGTKNVRGGKTIQSYWKERILTPIDNGHGYKIVGLCKDGCRKNHYIHRLVADAFVDNKDGKPNVNHKDFDTSNNKAENLEFVTQLENCQWSHEHYFRPKTFVTQSGYKHIRCRRNRYTVEVKYQGKFYAGGDGFSSLQDAIERRDQIYDQIHYYR